KIRERRHEAAATIDYLANLLGGEAPTDADERRSAISPPPILAVTVGAGGSVHLCARAGSSNSCHLRRLAHRCNPGNVARVHVDDSGFAVDGGAAPFAAAVEPGQHDGTSATGRRE